VAEHEPSLCRFIQQENTAALQAKLEVITNDDWNRIPGEQDHFALEKKKNSFFHLDVFNTDSSDELRGLQLYQFGNRLAVRAYYANGTPDESRDFSADYKQYDDTFAFVDKAPVYTGAYISRLGLKVKGGNRISFDAYGPEGHEIKNDEWNQDNYIRIEDCSFVDTNVVMAPAQSRVVGFGFRKKGGNRFAPYLLTVPAVTQV